MKLRQPLASALLLALLVTPPVLAKGTLAAKKSAIPAPVSTLKEAEQFFAHGITNILYAVGITPNKLDHVADLRRRGADITIILDSLESARIVARRGARHAHRQPGSPHRQGSRYSCDADAQSARSRDRTQSRREALRAGRSPFQPDA